jgi:sulfur-oxidizing protein SoxB
MFSRREFLQIGLATAALVGGAPMSKALASQSLSQSDLLAFEPTGNVTLLHLTDLHAQLVPVYFREPAINLGVGEVAGLPPHITGDAFLKRFGIEPKSRGAYMLSSENFVDLAKSYGRIGGLDRLATLVNAIRAERPNQTLLLDGGDTWQGSYTSLATNGADMVKAMNALGVDAMTAHWEFTYGTDRVQELIEALDFPFLAANVRDTDWEEPVFEAYQMFERGGVSIAVIGQAFPYTPIANPRYMIPNWSFGVREEAMQKTVDEVREAGADLVVLLSHNGFDVDRKLISRVNGIDVALSGHTHDAVPEAVQVGKTLLIASGSHGKFLSRLDLDVQNKEIKEFRYSLIPVLSDAIEPDPEMAALISEIREPHEAEVSRVLGQTDSLLYRRGNFNGTFDDLICDALRSERDAEIALSPGFRWGATLLPGQSITVDDVYNMTSITYPNAYRVEMTGQALKEILEDVADNLFNLDPYYQQGGDMVRVGGMGYRINIHENIGSRISEMTLLPSGDPVEADKSYVVSGWASVNEGTEGPPVYDLVSQYIEKQGQVSIQPNDSVQIVS